MSKYLTPEDLEKIKKELDYLKKVKRKEIAQRLKEAIAMGDLTENSAYQEAKDAQGFLEGKILELENLIGEAKLVEKIDGAHWVQIGSTVILAPQKQSKTESSPPEEGAKVKKKTKSSSPRRALAKREDERSSSPNEKHKIVGTGQADPFKGEISMDSPLGKALLDKPEGAVVEIKTPIGKIKYKILKIE